MSGHPPNESGEPTEADRVFLDQLLESDELTERFRQMFDPDDDSCEEHRALPTFPMRGKEV